jgi:hypothetical protein
MVLVNKKKEPDSDLEPEFAFGEWAE